MLGFRVYVEKYNLTFKVGVKIKTGNPMCFI